MNETFQIPQDFPITHCPDSRSVDPTGLRMNPKTKKWTRREINSRINKPDKEGTFMLLDPRWERLL